MPYRVTLLTWIWARPTENLRPAAASFFAVATASDSDAGCFTVPCALSMPMAKGCQDDSVLTKACISSGDTCGAQS